MCLHFIIVLAKANIVYPKSLKELSYINYSKCGVSLNDDNIYGVEGNRNDQWWCLENHFSELIDFKDVLPYNGEHFSIPVILLTHIWLQK